MTEPPPKKECRIAQSEINCALAEYLRLFAVPCSYASCKVQTAMRTMTKIDQALDILQTLICRVDTNFDRELDPKTIEFRHRNPSKDQCKL